MIDRKHLTTQLISMMSYKRPAYSVSETEFANKFLSPVFGEPDGHGNFICVVGQSLVCCLLHTTIQSIRLQVLRVW